MNRFFVEGRCEPGDCITFAAADAHKILHVLRLHGGDYVEVIDSTGRRYAGALREGGRSLQADIVQTLALPTEERVQMTVAQAVPKGQKMDFVVEKLTELGAAAIVPMITERTIVSAPAVQKVDRWQRLAKSAAAQCGRTAVPRIDDVQSFDEVLASFTSYERVLLPWELAEHTALRGRLPALLDGVATVLVLIGPEGGFSHDEAEAARAAGAEVISLGDKILRTETAALVLLAIIGYIVGDG